MGFPFLIKLLSQILEVYRKVLSHIDFSLPSFSVLWFMKKDVGFLHYERCPAYLKVQAVSKNLLNLSPAKVLPVESNKAVIIFDLR